MDLKTSDFDYLLPEELIAQEPVERRDRSRLLLLPRNGNEFEHRMFYELVELLRSGDRLVLNDTRVLPARLFCHKLNGTPIELLFLAPVGEQGEWKALARPARRLRRGTELIVDADETAQLQVVDTQDDGTRIIRLAAGLHRSLPELIERCGVVPLPPYIERSARQSDRENYQTIYARESGAVAAPTAGLHFTPELMERLDAAGIGRTCLTLHVGIGTFRPVQAEDPRQHPMHTEEYRLSDEAAREINETRQCGGRIIAVGTTAVRTLEHCSDGNGGVLPGTGYTNMYILPGYRFTVVDGLITNFHLPRSTLLMLVSALAGRERVLAAYREAVARKYRFYSYGDAMLIV
jgi:S-adenosylmethionine:tRNA ribosyltransferase-isomerase